MLVVLIVVDHIRVRDVNNSDGASSLYEGLLALTKGRRFYMIKFITTPEGILVMFACILILAGGISELIYFHRLCKSSTKGYDDLAEDLKEEVL